RNRHSLAGQAQRAQRRDVDIEGARQCGGEKQAAAAEPVDDGGARSRHKGEDDSEDEQRSEAEGVAWCSGASLAAALEGQEQACRREKNSRCEEWRADCR